MNYFSNETDKSNGKDDVALMQIIMNFIPKKLPFVFYLKPAN